MNFNKFSYDLGAAPSGIRELFAFAQKRAAIVGPENVFDFSIGNPSVPAPKEVEDAMKEIIENMSAIDLHAYTNAAGAEGTRAAIAGNLTRRFGVEFGADDIYVTVGAAAALNIVLRSLIAKEDDEIILLTPFFPEYTVFTQAQGGVPVICETDENLMIDIDKLAAAINENTKGIIINNPNNPAGVIYTEENLKAAFALLEEKEKEYGHPIFVIADEPYRELVYSDNKPVFLPTLYKNTVICYSWSKSLSLPGERIGYVALPKQVDEYQEFIYAINGAGRGLGYVNAPSLMQYVVEKCIDVEPDLAPYIECRDVLVKELSEMGYNVASPDGAFYLFIEAPDGNGADFCARLKEKDVLLVPGGAFASPRFARLAYCCPADKVRRAMPKFKEVMETYK